MVSPQLAFMWRPLNVAVVVDACVCVEYLIELISSPVWPEFRSTNRRTTRQTAFPSYRFATHRAPSDYTYVARQTPTLASRGGHQRRVTCAQTNRQKWIFAGAWNTTIYVIVNVSSYVCEPSSFIVFICWTRSRSIPPGDRNKEYSGRVCVGVLCSLANMCFCG